MGLPFGNNEVCELSNSKERRNIWRAETDEDGKGYQGATKVRC